MLTHAETNARFVALDSNPILQKVCFDGWLAWPIVKERIWLACMMLGEEGAATSGSRKAFSRLEPAIMDLTRGFLRPQRCATAALYTPRQLKMPDGRFIHPHLGDLSKLQAERPWLNYLFGPAQADGLSVPHLHHDGLGAIPAVMAKLTKRRRLIQQISAELAAAIAPTLPELSDAEIFERIADMLARFRLRFWLCRALLRRWNVSRLIVLDPDGKVPEVAAAKDLGLPVLEVQHGMFSCYDPEYAWKPLHRNLLGRMPVPDQIVVFGPLWRQQLKISGYWQDHNVIEACNPVIPIFRAHRAAYRLARQPEGPLRVLFPTQDHLRDHSVEFWSKVLDELRQLNDTEVHLRIKLHPGEWAHEAEYRVLVDAFPERCSMAAIESDGFTELMEADLVAGYTSLMMLEALGIGVPVVGLADAAGGSFWETYNTPELRNDIREARSPDEFVTELAYWKGQGVREFEERSSEIALKIYSFDAPPIEEVLEETKHTSLAGHLVR